MRNALEKWTDRVKESKRQLGIKPELNYIPNQEQLQTWINGIFATNARRGSTERVVQNQVFSDCFLKAAPTIDEFADTGDYPEFVSLRHTIKELLQEEYERQNALVERGGFL